LRRTCKSPHSSVFAPFASGAFYETIVPVTFYEIIRIHNDTRIGCRQFADLFKQAAQLIDGAAVPILSPDYLSSNNYLLNILVKPSIFNGHLSFA
jgi:hypothetical protein